ncbi:branched-chain amino acid ABC transporter permease [Gulosibacter sp. 10]|uniref:branched-chain amino acid ABC transporter permease n=1 Tax=Gulosibacter sp. 10 TaxID=1255570 RepID=UPI00097EAC53|nr:branched-chain amino acid ABC transporter permease [Gulosibacter sp. 10]SJM60293.1 Branched-chain amino acid transport system permease protein LivM (TC 3.A.1.4.1) [Gulosibacter sp. 10]
MFTEELRSTKSLPLILCGIAVLVAVIGVVSGSIILYIATLALISVVFVVGLFTFSGNSGIMSFGHVAFMAIGAYATAYLTIPAGLKQSMFSSMPEPFAWVLDLEVSFPVALLLSGVAAAGLALLTGPAIARLGGLQAGIATLSLLLIVFTVINNWTDVTRGSSSMIGIPQAVDVWWALGAAVLAIVLAWLYKVSSSGLQLRASREDAGAAEASGISVGRHRFLAWVLSGFLCGISGSLYASFLTTFHVSAFFIAAMFGFVVMIVVGGYLSLSGAVMGTLLISALQEFLRRVQDGQILGIAFPPGTAELVLAVILLIVLIVRPLGIMGHRELGFRRRARGRAAPAVAEKA